VVDRSESIELKIYRLKIGKSLRIYPKWKGVRNDAKAKAKEKIIVRITTLWFVLNLLYLVARLPKPNTPISAEN
jgi:hypothetical protein